MTELSAFIGQIVSDIADARTQTDAYAAGASELYHADPFIRNLPIPHYTIESAEVDVPVIVVGIAKNADDFDERKQRLFAAIREKLPVTLMRNYKFSYLRAREREKERQTEKAVSREKLRREANGAEEKPQRVFSSFDAGFSDDQLQEYEASSRTVTEKMVAAIAGYLDTYNYEIIKILDLTDEFVRALTRELKRDAASYKKEFCPFADHAAILSAAQYIGNVMFFEFKKIIRSSAAVQIDVNTVQMNEYATRDCLMHVRLKIREQDLSLLTEEDGQDRERRFLSLS